MSGVWIGFDADMAKSFADSLCVEAECVVSDGDNKILELDGKAIDCVWNGMTLTDEVKSSMECSNAYLNNAQIVIVPGDKADQYQDLLSQSITTNSASTPRLSAKDFAMSASKPIHSPLSF